MAYPVSGWGVDGLLAGYVNVDILVGPFPTAQTIVQFSPLLTSQAPIGGTLDVSLHVAAGGAGDSIDVSFISGSYNATGTGSLSIAAGGYAYVRVTADGGTTKAQGLGGFFLVESSAPVEDIVNEPLTLGEVKRHLNIAISDYDTDLGNMIARVRAEAEELCGIPIISQTKTMYLDRFPTGDGGIGWWDGVRDGIVSAGEAREIEIIPGNLQSVTSLTTYDDSDDPTVMSSNNYYVDLARNRIVLRDGQSWPVVSRVAQGIVIVLLMGWATPSVVPGDLKERLKERIAQRWHARPESTEAQLKIGSGFYGKYARPKLGRRNL